MDINNPDIRYTLKSISGDFSGLQLLSYMYVGFGKIDLKMDVGIDFSQEYKMAVSLFDSEEIKWVYN